MEVYALASFHGSTNFYLAGRVYIYSFSIHFYFSLFFACMRYMKYWGLIRSLAGEGTIAVAHLHTYKLSRI